ncbi:MAG TPA: hypothetical protein VNY52_01500 [Solirubrobacteraceae bacterium]|nr:hypothetical protein [Solirubrobacteraceae bacterium]
MKAKARIAALFNRSGAGRDAERVACALRVSSNVHGGGAPAAGRARLAFACASSVTLIAILAILLTSVAPAAASEGCPNEARREEQGAAGRALPDCRAYELVSQPSQPSPYYNSYFAGFPPSGYAELSPPGESSGQEPLYLPEEQEAVSIALDGNAVLFGSQEPNSESNASASNLSRRGPDGWIGENIIPPRSRVLLLCNMAGYAGFSANLEQVAVSIGSSEEGPVEDCGHAEPPLVSGESEESSNLFLRDTATHSFQLLNVTPPGARSYDPHPDAISADGSHVVFQSRSQLTSDAPNGEAIDTNATAGHCANDYGNVYLWSAGAVRLPTVLPDGTPVRGTLAGASGPGGGTCGEHPGGRPSFGFAHPISADGERTLFYAGGGFEINPSSVNQRVSPRAPYIDGGLYLRENAGRAPTASGACDPAEPDNACTIQIDVPEGGSGSPGNGQFQWANSETTTIFFTDEEPLTAGSTAAAGRPDLYEYDLEKPAGQRLADLTMNAAEPADVLGVSGASEDGSYAYFVARGVLSGSQENSRHAKAVAGEANLYLRHAGATTFIANLNAEGGDQCDWNAVCLTSRVSQNGAYIAFDSIDSLTGYDNHPVHPEACAHLTGNSGSPCIEAFRYAAAAGAHGELTCATCNPTGAPPASEFAWSVIRMPYHGGLSSAVSDSGQVFFETMENLLPADENKTWDVYEYEGGEGPSAQLHLISSGKSEQPSYFAGATPDGSNVFFVTFQSLLRADTRTDYDLYDARVGGGFAEPLVPPCEVEGCRSAYPGAPASVSPASASLEGKGNVPPVGKDNARPGKCKKGFLRSRGRCVKQHSKQKKHHRRSARRNRRAAK